MTVVNFSLALVLFGYTAYLVFKCRHEVRPMMIVYLVAGIWALAVHSLVMWDQCCTDFMAWQFVTNYLIRPLLFVLMATVLAAVIKSGWRYDD